MKDEIGKVGLVMPAGDYVPPRPHPRHTAPVNEPAISTSYSERPRRAVRYGLTVDMPERSKQRGRSKGARQAQGARKVGRAMGGES